MAALITGLTVLSIMAFFMVLIIGIKPLLVILAFVIVGAIIACILNGELFLLRIKK